MKDVPNSIYDLKCWLEDESRSGILLLPETILLARDVAFIGWKERAAERSVEAPTDLSFSCKFSSIFLKMVFGGEIRGNYDHQFNFIEGQIIDINEGAGDILMLQAEGGNPYEHDPSFFGSDDHLESMFYCLERAATWKDAFMTKINEIDKKKTLKTSP